jgi:hypothetical protein
MERYLFFRDPQGNAFEITEWKRRWRKGIPVAMTARLMATHRLSR